MHTAYCRKVPQNSWLLLYCQSIMHLNFCQCPDICFDFLVEYVLITCRMLGHRWQWHSGVACCCEEDVTDTAKQPVVCPCSEPSLSPTFCRSGTSFCQNTCLQVLTLQNNQGSDHGSRSHRWKKKQWHMPLNNGNKYPQNSHLNTLKKTNRKRNN